MADQPTMDELTTRIDDLEAVVNGLMTYIATKELGLEVSADELDAKSFFKTNVMRQYDARLTKNAPTDPLVVKAVDGFFDALPFFRIADLKAKLRYHFRMP